MTYPRDLVGYGENPPDPKWPNGARLALNIVLNYEEGSEYSILDGDDASETQLNESTPSVPLGMRDLAVESTYEFGSRVGVWRLLKLFRERTLPITVFGCALALERNPDVARAIVSANYDICCHGFRWEKHWLLDEVQEQKQIEDAIASLENLTGSRPLGWYCRTGPSVNTRRLLVENGGFLYDSDAYNDELPYWLNVADKSHLVIPYTNDVNDTKFFNPSGYSSGEDFFTYLKDSFDVLYNEGISAPKMLSVGLHARIVGRPGRIAALSRFLDYVQGHEDVWICRREDIARHWIASHPPPTI
jgi:allantoinase